MTRRPDELCTRCREPLPHDTQVCQMAPGAVDRHGSEAPHDPLSTRGTAANAAKFGLGCLLLVALVVALWLLAQEL